MVSFFLPKTPGVFEAALDANPGLMFFSFGDHADMMRRVREKDHKTGSRTHIVCQVGLLLNSRLHPAPLIVLFFCLYIGSNGG